MARMTPPPRSLWSVPTRLPDLVIRSWYGPPGFLERGVTQPPPAFEGYLSLGAETVTAVAVGPVREGENLSIP